MEIAVEQRRRGRERKWEQHDIPRVSTRALTLKASRLGQRRVERRVADVASLLLSRGCPDPRRARLLSHGSSDSSIAATSKLTCKHVTHTNEHGLNRVNANELAEEGEEEARVCLSLALEDDLLASYGLAVDFLDESELLEGDKRGTLVSLWDAFHVSV